MKFFWKIFFSTILIAAVTFSFGSYYLIDSQFRSALKREIESLYEENEILSYTFTANKQFQEIIAAMNPESGTAADQDERALLGQAARAVSVNTGRGALLFRLSDKAFEAIYSSGEIPLDQGLLRQLPLHSRGCRLELTEGSYYLQAARPLNLAGEQLYLENFRDVSFLFSSRSESYRDFSRLMIVMILSGAAVTYGVTQWLMRPLKRLSRATKRLAGGDFSQRLAVQGSDEISLLAGDYNRMADRLEELVKKLKENARRQEDFVASFAHELKTPLTSIIGYADMLRSKKLGPEQVVLSANYIFREGKRLEALSMKLLELIVLGRQDFPLKEVQARSFFASIQGLMLPALVQENIGFTVEAEEAVLQIEPDLLKTVCLNRLDNARKALEGRGGRIFFGGRRQEEGYLIWVEDNGKGIEEGQLARITEAFYMVDKSRARAQGGAGLGLAICQEILNLHKSRLEFASVPGEGTRAAFFLPPEYVTEAKEEEQ